MYFSFCLFHADSIRCSVAFADNKKLPVSKLYPVMDANDDPEEDHLTSYDVQYSRIY